MWWAIAVAVVSALLGSVAFVWLELQSTRTERVQKEQNQSQVNANEKSEKTSEVKASEVKANEKSESISEVKLGEKSESLKANEKSEKKESSKEGSDTKGKGEEEEVVREKGKVADLEQVEVEQQKEQKMDDSELDDLLDDAFDELDILDDVADDMLLEETAAAVQAVAPPKAKRDASKNYVPPKTWQETLSVLDPKERIEWAKVISKDITVQANLKLQPMYSNAYKDGELSSGGGNAVTALVQGGGIVRSMDAREVLTGVARNAIVVVNKRDSKNFVPSESLLNLFYDQIKMDSTSRLEYDDVEQENVYAEPDRFARCRDLLDAR